MKLVDLCKLEDVSKRLGEAALDPLMWPMLMEDICTAVGAEGAGLLQSDVRTEDIPRTASVAGFFKIYFDRNLHVTDVRAARGVPLLLTKTNVVTDADLFGSEAEMLQDPLYINLAEWGLKWFAVVGFRAGPALWGLTIQRTPREGMFDHDEVAALSQLSQRLTEAATLSTAVGRVAISGITNALGLMHRPAFAVDRFGTILGMNSKADGYLGREIFIRHNRLVFLDKKADSELTQLIDRLKGTSDTLAIHLPPLVVRRTAKRPLMIQALPVPPAARSPFLGARAVLVLKDLDVDAVFDQDIMSRAFKLTPAQAKLAATIAAGTSLEEAAIELGMALETARSHLKAIFNKTETHRQGQLVALLNKVSASG